MTHHFVNLTDGIEWLPMIGNHFSFLRIESTAIEKNDWMGLLLNLDNNLLMRLALGEHCIVYDCGTRRPTSKTISKGIPFIRQFLHTLWIDKETFRADTDIKRRVKKKLEYYRRFLNTTQINLSGRSKATVHDGDRAYYRQQVLSGERHVARMA